MFEHSFVAYSPITATHPNCAFLLCTQLRWSRFRLPSEGFEHTKELMLLSTVWGDYHVNKVERTTLGSHDLAVSIFQNFLPISRSLSKCKISNTLTAISREVPLIPS